MKKFLSLLLLSLSFGTLSATTYSKTIITINWPFDTASNQANFIRIIVEEANRQQNKYLFLYNNKPGAGGTIAAKHVLSSTKEINLLSTSSSFWVRPIFYPNESHKVEDFQPIMIECIEQPYIIISSKYSSLKEIQQQKELNIGVGLGSLTEAVAREFQTKLPNTKLNYIGYNGSIKPMMDVQAGLLDLSVGLPADTKQYVEINRLVVIGSSGWQNYSLFPTFNSQGVKGFENLVSNYAIYAPITMNNKTAKELHNILNNAAMSSTILSTLYANDLCSPVNLNYEDTIKIFNKWFKYWPEKLQSLKNN